MIKNTEMKVNNENLCNIIFNITDSYPTSQVSSKMGLMV